jgi:hypothetical protein
MQPSAAVAFQERGVCIFAVPAGGISGDNNHDLPIRRKNFAAQIWNSG